AITDAVVEDDLPAVAIEALVMSPSVARQRAVRQRARIIEFAVERNAGALSLRGPKDFPLWGWHAAVRAIKDDVGEMDEPVGPGDGVSQQLGIEDDPRLRRLAHRDRDPFVREIAAAGAILIRRREQRAVLHLEPLLRLLGR